MKVNYILAIIFLAFVSIVVIANIDETTLIGCTELNGSGCVCHTTEKDSLVKVWVEGPESLLVGQTGLYKMFMAGGPAQAGGYNVAGRFGEMVLIDTFSTQHPLTLNELTQAFSLPFPTQQDTIYWEFGYKALESASDWDTIYSCGLSLVWDSIPDFHDRWNFGLKFPVKILSVTDVEDDAASPDEIVLYQNYPNPFNPSTKIKYSISNVIANGVKQSQFVSLRLFDITGNEITTLVKEDKFPGDYEVIFDASGLPSGIYFYKLETGNYTSTKKMILLK